MAENENNTVENTVDENVTKVDMSKFKSSDDDNVIKVDLSKPTTNETEETTADPAGVVGSDENADTTQEQEEVQPQGEVQEAEAPVLEEIVDEEVVTDTVEQPKQEVVEETPTIDLPENLQKLVEFMNDTGGSLEDYVRLNTDISKLDTSEVLDEYYKQTKSHLSADERSFLLEETFSYDEELDDPKDIKRKQIKLKEEAAKARKYLEDQKSNYYEDIKAGSKLTAEQQKAVDFFNRYNKDSEAQKAKAEASTKAFLQKTDNLFNQEFKGFDFKVGDKKFRYNVKNINEVKTTQSDLNNFINKFVGSDNQIQDAAGYHKSLFTAMNADAIAQHFYEQGKADAIKQSVADAKNVNTEARSSQGETNVGGVKVRVLGDNSSSLKFKIKKR